MASNSETGNAVNISNWKLLIDTATGYGVKYNPGNTNITIAAMTTKWTTAKTNQQALTDAKSAAIEPINAREILFAPLNPLVTRCLGYLKGSGASAQVIADAKTIADDIRGNNKQGATKSGDKDVDGISQSHMSFVQRAENFRQLIALLKTITAYNPNETDLKTTALDTYSGQLDTSNNGLGAIILAASTAAINRNRALYATDTGIVDLSAVVKEYIKSIFGSKSAEYKQASGIKFRGKKVD